MERTVHLRRFLPLMRRRSHRKGLLQIFFDDGLMSYRVTAS
jgi:hypothetical protein